MNTRKKILAQLLTLTTTAGAMSAQKMLSYLPTGSTSSFTEECVPSPACGAAGVIDYSTFPAPTRPNATPAGAVCLDDRSGVVYSTNGHLAIQRRVYPHLSCGGSGTTLPSLPIPTTVGVVRGMAVDPVTKHLYLTNGLTIFQVDPTAGMAVLSSWPASPINVLAGLDLDLDTPGLVIGVSTAGEVVEYVIGGGIASLRPPTYPWPGAEAVGVARDRTDATSCHDFVLHANGDLYDHSAGLLVRTRAANRVGLTFLPAPLRLDSGIACSGAAPIPTASEFPIAGSATFSIELCSLPLGTSLAAALIGFPAAPASVALPIGGMWVGSAPIAIPVPVVPGAASTTLALSLAAGTVPTGLDVQFVIDCTSSPWGVILTDGLQIELSR